MHSKGFLVMEDEGDLGWFRGQDELITWKDNVIYLCFKMLLKERDLELQQGLRATLPSG